MATSNDITPGPFSEQGLRKAWNQQADQFNQWDSLDSCEQLAWAQTQAIAADRARRPALVEPVTFELQWSENKPPCEECKYDHCKAQTPFGSFLITWKSWKEYDSPTVDKTPWGDFYQAFATVELAKAACQREFDARLALCGHNHPAPARPVTPIDLDALLSPAGPYETGPDDGDWADMVDLCVAEGVPVKAGTSMLRRARAAWGQGQTTPAPDQVPDPTKMVAPPAEREVGKLVAAMPEHLEGRPNG